MEAGENKIAAGSEHNLYNNLKIQSLYVKGYFNNVQSQLVEYFSTFGKITRNHFGPGFAFIDFSDPNSVEKVMSHKVHIFKGRKLYVDYNRNSIRVPVNSEETQKNIHEAIVSKLEPLDNFDQEFFCLADMLQPDFSESFSRYNILCADLYNVLGRAYPDVVVHRFGSSLTGLAFGNSDVDIYLSNVSRSKDEVKKLWGLKKLLMRSGLFTNCLVIAAAKIPIVKCLHRRTNIQCDINIKSNLGVHNSALVHYYLSADVKIRRAMLIIKYWARCLNISGKQNLFTSYCLTLMFIFVLQREPYKLSSVCSLQERVYDDSVWADSVRKDHRFNTEKIQSTPLKDIVRQFFEFYANFDFTSHIISPYLGEILPLAYFECPEQIPDCYQTYRQLLRADDDGSMRFTIKCPVSVQDPFEHSRNVSANVGVSTLQRFQLALKRATEIFAGDRILYRLCTEQITQPRASHPVGQIIDDAFELKLTRSANLRYLTLHQSTGDESLDDRWFESLKRFLLMVFKDFLLFTQEEVRDDESRSKGIKATNQKDIHDNVQYIFSTKVNVWTSRKQTAKLLDLSGANGLVERELAITEHLKKSRPPFVDLPAPLVSFKMKIVRDEGGATICINKISSYKKLYKSFICLMYGLIPTWLEHYEKDLNDSAMNSIKS
ncbi:speckle targeted PIP5K1A-regulated poly(A) polymerase-like [Rhynchophorus ferrugineus]|uniref:speckle targeted PIP5K1A-regulated poly(A) polymerase-like n=1 Tax=Rhynchophorus ferrugineus TaxID=354439 RepID=UPI003FCD3C5F